MQSTQLTDFPGLSKSSEGSGTGMVVRPGLPERRSTIPPATPNDFDSDRHLQGGLGRSSGRLGDLRPVVSIISDEQKDGYVVTDQSITIWAIVKACLESSLSVTSLGDKDQ